MASQRLQELRDELNDLDTAISNMRSTGQKYSLVGSHTWEGQPVTELYKRRTVVRNAIYALSGGQHFTIPDYS